MTVGDIHILLPATRTHYLTFCVRLIMPTTFIPTLHSIAFHTVVLIGMYMCGVLFPFGHLTEEHFLPQPPSPALLGAYSQARAAFCPATRLNSLVPVLTIVHSVTIAWYYADYYHRHPVLCLATPSTPTGVYWN